MAKLSKLALNQQALFDAHFQGCMTFLDSLLDQANKKRSAPGSNQALKRCLPSPYMLRHVCPMIAERAGCRRDEGALIQHMPDLLRKLEARTFVRHPNLSRLPLACDYLLSVMYGHKVECFRMLCLDKGGKLKEDVLLNMGVYDASIFSLRLMLEEIDRVRPAAIILSHNHPAGTTLPSREDLDCTAEALYALTSLGIPMLDHIIACNDCCVSLRANGFIAERYWANQCAGHKLLSSWLSVENMPDRSLNRTGESYLPLPSHTSEEE